jgi:hypothetical protein
LSHPQRGIQDLFAAIAIRVNSTVILLDHLDEMEFRRASRRQQTSLDPRCPMQ